MGCGTSSNLVNIEYSSAVG